MKFMFEAVLIIILVVLMYNSPAPLRDFANSVLGKMVCLAAIAYIAMTYGRNSGLIAAFIFILLIHNEREGLENPPKGGTKKKGKSSSASAGKSKELLENKTRNKGKQNKKEGLGRAKMLQPAPVSQKNIVDEDRKRKVNALMKSQEARGQFGGESKGMVGKPEI